MTERGAAAAGARVPPARPRVHLRDAVLVTLSVLLLVALAEISRLSGQQLDLDARSWSFESLMGPGRLLDWSTEGWTALRGLDQSPDVPFPLGGWLTAYLLLDLVLIACYWSLAHRALHTRHRPALRLVGVAALADLVENLLAAVAWPMAPRLTAPWLVGSSAVKWLFAVLFLLVLARRLLAQGDDSWRTVLRRWARAVYTQRFSVLPLVPLVVMAVVPGPNLLDQLPDIQRRWAQGDLGHGLAAAVALAGLAVAVLAVGRMRTDFTWWRVEGWGPGHPRPQPLVGFWFIAVVVILVLGLGLPWLTGTTGLSVARLAVFAGVPLAVGVVSALLRAVLADPRGWPWWWLPEALRRALVRLAAWVPRHVQRPDGRVLTGEHLGPIWLVGDVMATLVLVVGGAGLVRSFTAVVVLDPSAAEAWLALGTGVLVAVGAWGATERGYRWLDRAAAEERPGWRGWWAVALRPGHGSSRRQVVGATVLHALSITGLLVVGSVPAWAAANLGVIACFVLAVTCLTGMVATAIALLQYGGSPPAFWLPGLRLTTVPVVSLLLITVLVASTTGGDARIHGVRSRPFSAAGMTPRPSVEEALETWLASPEPCRVEVEAAGRRVTLRPMLLLAAEGGGVRASYWTAASLDLLAGRPLGDDGWGPRARGELACGAASTLLSGGASGGAVGLVAARFAGAGSARDEVVRIAGADALGSGVVGLIVRDLVYGGAGLPLPVIGEPGPGPDGQQWVDRAGLMELVWQGLAPGLDEPFLPRESEPPGRPSGHLVLTSTSVTTGCRVFVSQLDLLREPLEVVSRTPGQCNELDRPAANSVDLFGTHGRPECLGEITAATAGMLTARFPYVTPSGVVDECESPAGRLPRQQLVDGGYTENTGLGTVVDLAPRWHTAVREHNTRQLAQPEPEMVVPLVVYLDNGGGSDLAAPSRDLTNELLVPPVGNQRAGFAQADTPALLQRAAALTEPDRLWSTDEESADLADAVADEIDLVRPRGVVVVHQSTFPAVTAPLGWVLSRDSMTSMDRALARQLERCDTTAPQNVLCRRGFGSLGDALAFLRP